MPTSPVHARITGPIVMIGFGSIGKGTLPLIEKHFEYDKSRLVIIDPHTDHHIADEHGVRFIEKAVTRDNYRELLIPLLTAGGGQGFCVNLSVDTSSVDIMTMCREIGALYIDTETALAPIQYRGLIYTQASVSIEDVTAVEKLPKDLSDFQPEDPSGMLEEP